eukprot:jgi/Undpi1/9/HiC_scaffold_1.g00009.m1
MGSNADTTDDDECRSSTSSGAQVLFRWEQPGSQRVAVSGEWCGWSETATPLLAERDVVGRDSVFKGEFCLPHGKHLFRFFVDGEWRHDPQLLSERDEETGELCNVIHVSKESELRLQLPEKGSAAVVAGREGGAGDPGEQRCNGNADASSVASADANANAEDGAIAGEGVPEYRRRRQESFSAVGACVVTSSVRKDGKLFIAMVGLPARGKSFVARSIARHLDWVGLKCRIFSLGMHRRKEVGVFQPAEYFEPGGEGEAIRRRIACEVLAEALTALSEDIDIAIYDASNISKDRRLWLAQEVEDSGLRCKLIFIESICHDTELLRRNVSEVPHSSPEYEQKTREEAETDFLSRIARYKSVYQPLEAGEGFSFIKLIDVGNQMVTNLISGYIPGRITLLCLNLHLKPRPIWMSRHGESEFNMQGRIGGDAPLTAAGKIYARKLAEFMNKLYPPSKCSRDSDDDAAGGGWVGAGDGEEEKDEEELVVWTSTMLRTGQTVAPMTMEREVIKWSQLSEISAGLMDSLTYAHVAAEMPQEYEARLKDKLRYRYPGGESYQDLFSRLEPVLFEMLRERSPLLVVGHQAILRVLYGYLTGKSPEECPTLDMPLHTAIKLTPMAYTCEEEWHRPLEECDSPVVDVKHPISDAQSA